MERKFFFPMSAIEALAKAAVTMTEEEVKLFLCYPHLRLVKNFSEGKAEVVVKHPPLSLPRAPLIEKPRYVSSLIASQAFIDLLARLANSGFTEDNVIALSELGFNELRHVFTGKAEIKNSKHVILCNQRPTNGFSPRLRIKRHDKIEPVVWEDNRCELFRTQEQKEGIAIPFCSLSKELDGKILANANFAQYLDIHPWLIPENWAGKNIFFPGTIYFIGDVEYCLFMEKFPRDWSVKVSTVKRLGPNDFVMIVKPPK